MTSLIKFAAGVMLLFAFVYAPEAYASYHEDATQDPQPAVQTDLNNNDDQDALDVNSPDIPNTGAAGTGEISFLVFSALLASAGLIYTLRRTARE